MREPKVSRLAKCLYFQKNLYKIDSLPYGFLFLVISISGGEGVSSRYIDAQFPRIPLRGLLLRR